MSLDKVYVDTTVLTDALLKQDQLGASARSALKNCKETILPVFAIKEFKAGPLSYYVYLHNKLLSTKSLANTSRAIAQLIGHQNNRAKTALTALSDLQARGVPERLTDEQLADLYRISIARLILSAWGKRRKITSTVSDELRCYSEDDPKVEMKTGRFSNPGAICKLYGTDQCCLSSFLKGMEKDLKLLIDAIKDRVGQEHTNRRSVLHKLANTPKRLVTARDCANLGDAYFALFAPKDASILTTNLKDHTQLANALGKVAVAPSDINAIAAELPIGQQS